MEDGTQSGRARYDIAYIYHVIGTLDWEHIVHGMESLKNQNIHWDTFILYNGGDFEDDDILALVPKDKFDNIEVYPYNPDTPKSSVADWNEQMKHIGGHDRYFVHKADFYMADGACEAFEETDEDGAWIVLFHKFDMKEKATIDTIRKYASLMWREAMEQPETGDYWGEHIGKLAIPFRQDWGHTDGTMHGYSDELRKFYKPLGSEIQARWGGTKSFEELPSDVIKIYDNRMFALHMFHYTEDRRDPVKLTEGERF